jgi:hypothetical protein
MVHLTSTKHG